MVASDSQGRMVDESGRLDDAMWCTGVSMRMCCVAPAGGNVGQLCARFASEGGMVESSRLDGLCAGAVCRQLVCRGGLFSADLPHSQRPKTSEKFHFSIRIDVFLR